MLLTNYYQSSNSLILLCFEAFPRKSGTGHDKA